jgi:hypothetical protein
MLRLVVRDEEPGVLISSIRRFWFHKLLSEGFEDLINRCHEGLLLNELSRFSSSNLIKVRQVSTGSLLFWFKGKPQLPGEP